MSEASCGAIAEHVADTAYGVDQRRLKSFIDFIAERIDMDIDNVTDAVEMNVPDVLHNHRPGHRPMGIAKQEFEEGIFFELEIDGLTGSADLPGRRVHL